MSIDHILKLARLEVSSDEKQKLEKDFSSILDFVKTLEEIKIDKEELKKQKKELQNVTREDEIQHQASNIKHPEKLIELAPETKDGYIKTYNILSF